MKTYLEGEGPRPNILIIDDDPSTLELLSSVLGDEGYQVAVSTRGDEALAQIEAAPPDLILLDLMMPGMEGIDVCRILHSDPDTSHIPVLLMTANRKREVRLEGIAAGARDFLLKPLDIPDLRVRVRNAAEMKRLFDQSEERFQKITALESLRDSLVHMIVHDLKSPLTAVMGNLQLMEMSSSDGLDPDQKSALDGCMVGAQKMNELISSILDVSKLESGQVTLDLSDSTLHDVAEGTLGLLGPWASRVRIPKCLASDRVSFLFDAGLIQRVVLNLLTNALEHSPEQHPVEISISDHEDTVRLTVLDQGPGVPEEARERVFEKFQQVAGTGRVRIGSVGLGLAFCKLAVEAHKGRVGVDTAEGGGSAFWFELPKAAPKF